ncbi:hypothetical protein ACFP3U_12200 [Kitasatospora misakiensis]|uniref:Uncharacterized protein n=1 Tax=Kitasatospora misakiensis TaxID=67330 RepID=A0ABW0X3G0_9ACTN
MRDSKHPDETPEPPSGDRWVSSGHVTIVEAYELAVARGHDKNVRLFVTGKDE